MLLHITMLIFAKFIYKYYEYMFKSIYHKHTM